MPLFIQKLVANATLPVRGSDEAAGYDLAACPFTETGDPRGDFGPGPLAIMPGGRAIIPTGLALTVPEGTYGRIGPRSGLAAKHGIDVLAGIVDRDYTGEIKVVLINHGKHSFLIEPGMRIAQLVLERIETPNVVEVSDLAASARGAGGFGSTGA